MVELVLGQRKLRADHDRAATGQIFEKLWQDRGPAASVLPQGQIQFECGHCRRIGLHRGDPPAVFRLVLELDVDRAATDAARFLLGQLEHLGSYPGQQVGREQHLGADQVPPFGRAEFRLQSGCQRLQGIFVGRRGQCYRRRLLRLVVLLGGLIVVVVVMMAAVVMVVVVVQMLVPLTDLLLLMLLIAGLLLLLRLMALVGGFVTVGRNRHQRCSEIVDFVGS